ncbi:MAG: hypothetical protein IH605_12970 [Burkholderiales bacterium]|nr:hypothetical protein [Burkholderiales bacterium]
MMPEDSAATVPDADTAETQEDAAFERIAYLFRRAGSDVTMQALMRAMIDYRKEQ